MSRRGTSFKVTERLAHDRALEGSDYRIVGKRIGAGNFGEVRVGMNVRTGEKVAIKIEISSEGNSTSKAALKARLRLEFQMLSERYRGVPRGQKVKGFPRPLHFGRCGSADCMVLDLLGPNLEDLFEMLGRRFSLKTVLMVALQLLDRLEQVHRRGLVYRDVKPENFLLGRRGGGDGDVIHLVDFGLTAPYLDSAGRHLAYRDVKTMTGTARYMSVRTHMGKLQSRRDDLESAGYVLVYFARGSLPWQGYRTRTLKEKCRKIRDTKLRMSPEEICRGLPHQFTAYMTNVKELGFYEDPDYEYLKDLFHVLYEEKGYSYQDASFDWSYMDLPSNVQKFNIATRKGGSRVSSVDTEDDSQEVFAEKEDEADRGGEDGGGEEEESNDAEGEEEDELGNLKNTGSSVRDPKNSNVVASHGVMFSEDVSVGKSTYLAASCSGEEGGLSKGPDGHVARRQSPPSSRDGHSPPPTSSSREPRGGVERDCGSRHFVESLAEERVSSFLCFSWKRKKRSMMT